MSQFRIPEYARDQQLQIFSPSVSSPTAMPVSYNRELEQILGIITSTGNVFAQWSQTSYYNEVNKRTRLGIASGEGQDAAAPIYEMFATGTVPEDMLATFQSASPADLVGTIRETMMQRADLAAAELQLPEDEAAAWKEGYLQQAMRAALPWAKDMIDTERGVISDALSADLRRPATTLQQSYAEGWAVNPATSNTGWRNYYRSVVVPAMQTMAADNNFAGVKRLYDDLASHSLSPSGELWSGTPEGASPLITPEVAGIYAAAKQQHTQTLVEQATAAIGSYVVGGTDPKHAELAIDSMRSAIEVGGRDPAFIRSMKVAVDEIMANPSGNADGFLRRLLIEGNDGELLLPLGHPARGIVVEALASRTTKAISESDRKNRADEVILGAIIDGKSDDEIRQSLKDRFGDAGLRYMLGIPELRDRLASDAVGGAGTTRALEISLAEAFHPDQIDELVGLGRTFFDTKSISGKEYLDLLAAAEKRNKSLPFDWSVNERTKELAKRIDAAFGITSDSAMIGRVGMAKPASEVKSFEELRVEARESWKAHVDSQLTALMEQAKAEGKTLRMSNALMDKIWSTWEVKGIHNSTSFINRASELRQTGQ